MRRILTLAVLVPLLGLVACGDDEKADDSKATTTIADTVDGDAAGSTAAATNPDLSAEVFASYSNVTLADANGLVDRANEATPDQAWNAEMITALVASFCNDWDSDDSGEAVGPLTDKGKTDWAEAIAVPLGISTANAKTAVEWVLADAEFAPPCQ